MDVPCTIAQLDNLLELYYPVLKGTKQEIYNCLLQQGRSNRQDISKSIDAKLSPYFVSQIEEMVDDGILTREGLKPMYYTVTYIPMEYTIGYYKL